MVNWFRSLSPVTVTEAIRQIILAAVLFGLLQWTTEQITGFLMAVSGVLALFVRGNTVSTQKLDLRVDERVALQGTNLRGTGGTGPGGGKYDEVTQQDREPRR